jgi:hypothetical protein
MTEQVVHVVMYFAFLGLGFIAGCAFKKGGYWLGRLHEFDYCCDQGWFVGRDLSPIRRPDVRRQEELGA